MRIAILGGDGFCGWPTALGLSAAHNDVLIVDNLCRRDIDRELLADSLTPIAPMEERIAAWEEVSGKRILFRNIDIAREYSYLLAVLREFDPTAIVHFAEQRAVPYAMRSSRHRRYTIDNNTSATHNVLNAIVDLKSDVHLVHLGSMGVYGYETTNAVVPEGYLDVSVRGLNGVGESIRVPYPARPGSVYHLTKALDAEMFRYFARHENVRITDLHQGIVWGTQTGETSLDPRLMNRFDYDDVYGTVLNRFLTQAARGQSLSVYGTGGQTRAFIHVKDTVACIKMAILNPPEERGEVTVRNQMTESHRVRDIARLVAEITGVDIAYQTNPRNEAAENEFVVSNESFISLGLRPTYLSDGLMNEVMDIARRYESRILPTMVEPHMVTQRWSVPA